MSELIFDQQVALVTGGASGIGLATVERFLADGASVLIADLNSAAIDRALQSLASIGYGERVCAEIADVSQEDQLSACCQRAVDQFGALDVAFLNAGVGGAFGSIADITQQHWDETFALLVRSVFLGIKHTSNHMADGGSIVVTSSVAGIAAGAGGHAYNAAKAAVINLVRSAAIELAARKIRVNSVAPGLISTPLVHFGDESRIPERSDAQPWPDLGQPDNIASAVAFLASSDALFVTGETLVVDGGLMANAANIWGQNLFTSGVSGMNRGSTGMVPTVNKS